MDVRIKKRLLPLTKIKAYKVLAGILRYTPKLWTEKKEGVSYKCSLT